ncbi:hypothetical protein Tco_0512486 [Tanacetum coccineum]
MPANGLELEVKPMSEVVSSDGWRDCSDSSRDKLAIYFGEYGCSGPQENSTYKDPYAKLLSAKEANLLSLIDEDMLKEVFWAEDFKESFVISYAISSICAQTVGPGVSCYKVRDIVAYAGFSVYACVEEQIHLAERAVPVPCFIDPIVVFVVIFKGLTPGVLVQRCSKNQLAMPRQ